MYAQGRLGMPDPSPSTETDRLTAATANPLVANRTRVLQVGQHKVTMRKRTAHKGSTSTRLNRLRQLKLVGERRQCARRTHARGRAEHDWQKPPSNHAKMPTEVSAEQSLHGPTPV